MYLSIGIYMLAHIFCIDMYCLFFSYIDRKVSTQISANWRNLFTFNLYGCPTCKICHMKHSALALLTTSSYELSFRITKTVDGYEESISEVS